MPTWTKESLSPPWPKSHDVKLAPADIYEAAQNAGGRDTLERHRPLSIVDHYGDKSRRAGTNGVSQSTENVSYQTAIDYSESNDDHSDWRKRLADPNVVVSVRDVKKATPEYVLVFAPVHFNTHCKTVSKSYILWYAFHSDGSIDVQLTFRRIMPSHATSCR